MVIRYSTTKEGLRSDANNFGEKGHNYTKYVRNKLDSLVKLEDAVQDEKEYASPQDNIRDFATPVKKQSTDDEGCPKEVFSISLKRNPSQVMSATANVLRYQKKSNPTVVQTTSTRNLHISSTPKKTMVTPKSYRNSPISGNITLNQQQRLPRSKIARP